MAAAQFHDFEIYQRLADMQSELGALKTRLDEFNGDGMASETNDDLTDHKIALSEAWQETKLTRLEGKIGLLASSIATLGSKIDSQRSEASAGRNMIMVTVLGTALTALALIFAILSYGASTFVNGTTVRDIVHNEVGAANGSRPGGSSPGK